MKKLFLILLVVLLGAAHTVLKAQIIDGAYTKRITIDRKPAPLPGVREPSWATLSQMAVSITGGNADTAVTGRIDPQREWPE